MTFEFYILVIPFCVIPIFLVSIDYLNKSAELKRKNFNVIDFDKFIKRKEEGDEVEVNTPGGLKHYEIIKVEYK